MDSMCDIVLRNMHKWPMAADIHYAAWSIHFHWLSSFRADTRLPVEALTEPD
jgi:hypothetical protein